MPIENADSLAFFFTTNDFGTDAVFTPAGGSASAIVGVFDNPYIGADAGGMVEFSATSPTFTARDVDFPGVAHGDQLVIGGATYLIREVMPDGTGITTVMLEEQ